MAIKFRCAECGQKIRVGDELAGRSGQCPTCRKPLTVPSASTMAEDDPRSPGPGVGAGEQAQARGDLPAPSGRQPSTAATGGRSAEAVRPQGAPKTSPGYITFTCPNCQKVVGYPAGLAGFPGACPNCRARIMVPRPGGTTFLVGGPEPARPVVRPGAAPRPGLRAAFRRVVRVPASPWKSLLILVACLSGLVVGGMLIWRELKGSLPGDAAGQGRKEPEPSRPGKAAATAPAPAPTAAAKPEPKPQAEAGPKAAAGSEIAGVQSIQVEIGSRPQATPTLAFDPVKAFALESRPKTETDTEEPDERAKAAEKKEASPAASKVEPWPEKVAEVQAPAPRPTPDPFIKPDDAQPPQPPPGLEVPPLPPPPAPCAECRGTGFLPLEKPAPYTYMEGDRPPDPAAAAPWRACPKCRLNADPKILVDAEAARLANVGARNAYWEQQLGLRLQWGETRHVTIHAELTPAATRNVLVQLDRLAARLQADKKCTVLTPARPDTHEIVILWDAPSYDKMINVMAQQNPGQDWELARKAMGVRMRTLSFFNAKRGTPTPPEHMALFQFAQMLMDEATETRAPGWLREGFAAYCENLILQKNLCYSFAYEANQVKFGPNWNAEIRKHAQQGKLKTWAQVFQLDLIGMKALDYLTCYSVVLFLNQDHDRFVKFVQNVRDVMDINPAMEQAYGKKPAELEALWARWTLTLPGR